MKVTIGDREIVVAPGTSIINLIEGDKYQYQAARVNNRIRELNYIIQGDSEIELLTLKDKEAQTMYQSTLRYLIIMAVKRLYPSARIIFNYSICRAMSATIANFNRPFLQSDLDKIQAELDNIIAKDLPISRYSITKEEAAAYYNEIGFNDKASILKYRKEETVHMYECDDYKNYMFGYMLPSTGFIKEYKLLLYAPGFIIQYPRSELGGKIPEFHDEKAFRDALREASQWGNLTNASYIHQMNELIEQGKALEFINLCETKHNNQFVALGKAIAKEIDRVRLIAVAGPSSSGKTTFTNRLKIQLRSLGIDPLMISIDDFYKVGHEGTPVDEFGKPDFEHIDSLDRVLFDEVMYKLIAGEAVALPHYSFYDRSRTFGAPVKLKPHQPIMIEGIHALNDMLTPSIDNALKFKVYIAPQIQLHIDDHNPIPITDIRLLRRMTRDYATRGTACEKTLDMWASVRRGEFRWIYPHQADADFIFNSELSYELCVIKKHVLPLLENIPSESPYFIPANRLNKFLKYFHDISDTWVPCNSILREFIGGSIFYAKE
jgi:uridine kinase